MNAIAKNPAVMMISGDYYHGKHHQLPRSYFFSRCIRTLGLGKLGPRAWNVLLIQCGIGRRFGIPDWLMRVGDGHKDFRDFWTEVFDTVQLAGRIDIWDYQWAYSTAGCWTASPFLPSRNLVKYIGYGSEATHTKGDGGWTEKIAAGSRYPFRWEHPAAIERDRVADRWIDLNVFGVEVKNYQRILRQFRYAPGCSSVAKIAVVVVKSTR